MPVTLPPRSRRVWLQCFLALSLWALVGLTRAQPAPTPAPVPSARLTVLLLTGQGTPDWRARADHLRALLEDSGRFTVKVCETPVGLSAETLVPFDLLVADCLGAELGAATTKAIERHLAAGKGVAIAHHGVRSLAGSDALERLLGLKVPASASPTEFRVLDLTLTTHDHPIIQSLAPRWQTGDHLIAGLAADKGFEVLATAAPDQPVIVAGSHSRGRVFATALGHDVGAMQEAVFIATFLRGAEWAASGRVTLPAALKTPTAQPGAPRVLVLTGGHDHEAAFYSLFNDVSHLGWVQVSDLKWTTQADLRPKCDVLVMYDFDRELDDKQKALLKTFIEAGKGLVVLHHGILNFQNWPWWYEEVVGGRYRLQREGSIPNSTVKMGQQHLITPVPGHPITAGIEPFRVIDETYKGLFISENNTPLLLSDSPTSDRTVGWIGPCKTSRVVFIQLGHDHVPVLHPSYRALVRNSILWAAGQLN